MSSKVLEERFKKAAPKAPLVAEAAVRTVEVAENQAKDSSRLVLLTRALNALGALFQKVDSGKVASASSDLEVLLLLLEQPEAIAELSNRDPLANAKLRGVRTQMKIVDAEGGSLSAKETGQILGISKAGVHKARTEGRLLGLPRGQNQYAFPVWQISSGQILPGLREVYRALDCEPWMKASFMLSPNTRLNNESPLVLLRRGETDRVVQAAKLFGEHGAA